MVGAKPATFGASLRKCREDEGLTRRQVADELGIDQRTVAFWENDEHEPGVRLMAALVRRFPNAELLDYFAAAHDAEQAARADGGAPAPDEDGAA
jgi:transcriptional regulator with XRE-family HTH domain